MHCRFVQLNDDIFFIKSLLLWYYVNCAVNKTLLQTLDKSEAKSQSNPKSKGEFGFWVVTKISWVTYQPHKTFRGSGREYMVQIKP